MNDTLRATTREQVKCESIAWATLLSLEPTYGEAIIDRKVHASNASGLVARQEEDRVRHISRDAPFKQPRGRIKRIRQLHLVHRSILRRLGMRRSISIIRRLLHSVLLLKLGLDRKAGLEFSRVAGHVCIDRARAECTYIG